MPVPRLILLDPQLAEKKVWKSLFDSVDKVWGDLGIDSSIENIRNLRTPYTYINNPNLTSTYTIDKDSEDLLLQDRETLLRTVEMLGVFKDKAGMFTDEELARIILFCAQHQNESAGTENFDDFLSFVLNGSFVVFSTWTEDYVSFYPEGDPTIGVPIYQGGNWYPTSHVILKYDISRFDSETQAIEFLYATGGIQLVLNALEAFLLQPIRFNVAVSASVTIFY